MRRQLIIADVHPDNRSFSDTGCVRHEHVQLVYHSCQRLDDQRVRNSFGDRVSFGDHCTRFDNGCVRFDDGDAGLDNDQSGNGFEAGPDPDRQ